MRAEPNQSPAVLVVDDARDIRVTLRVCLEGAGCLVTLAATPEAALESASRESFDLVLLDLCLGEANGLDLLPKLLALQPNLAVVIITASPELGSALDAFELGAADYIPKPFTPAEIRRVVDRILSDGGKRAAV